MSNTTKDLLLIEKSKYQIKGGKSTDKYTLEGVFTEFDSENRNGRVYTKKEFMPHFEALKKTIDSGKCLGELDHPKQYETSLKNVSHKVEDIWIDESTNKVMGRIKLLDTDAGRQAKALVDGGIPLHISSRAAGTVTEDKSVKIHKLFTYDLVDTPGFENAIMNSVNESYGFNTNESEDYSSFLIYEIDKETNQFSKPVDTNGLNNKNNEQNVDYIKENEFNEYTQFTKSTIGDIKKELNDLKSIQESIIKQNDHMVDEFNSTQSINEGSKVDTGIMEKLDKKIKAIEAWSEHVVGEFKKLKETKEEDELEDSVPAEFEVGKQYKDFGVVSNVQNSEDGGVNVWFDAEDEPMFFPVKESVEVQKTNIKKDATTKTVEKEVEPTLMDKGIQVGDNYEGKGIVTQVQRTESGEVRIYLDSQDEPIIVGDVKEALKNALTKLAAIEKWASHVTESVTGLEKWSDHVTETVTAIESWSDEATETVSKLEESISTGVNKEQKGQLIKESADIDSFKTEIFGKIDQIIESKKQGTTVETINESKETKAELLTETEKPLWLEKLPAKYEKTWESLAEAEQAKIVNRATLCEFKTSSSIREFWNTTFTKENLIKKEAPKQVTLNETQLAERRSALVENYRRSFGK